MPAAPQDFIDELQVEFKFARIVCEAGFTGEPDLRAEECAAVPIPLFERFVLMMWDYIRFDFGESYFQSKEVVTLVIETIPVSISLGLWSTLIAYLVSIPLGIRKAVRDGTRFDTWTSGAIIVGYAIPGFLFAVLLVVVFAGGSYLDWFPLRGLTSNDWTELSWLGRYGLYLPYVAAALGAALIAGLAAEARGGPRGFALAGLGALVVAGGSIAVLTGDLLGSGRQHLWLVLLPPLLGLLTSARRLGRTDLVGLPRTKLPRFLRLLLAAVPGFALAILIIACLSSANLVGAVPPGVAAGDVPVTLFGRIGDYFWHVALPVLASSIAGFATLTLLTKNSFLDEIKKQYVMTAKAKGLTERRVLYGHVFRNAMLIVIAGFPSLFIGIFFGGSLIIETLFSLDGLGRLGFEATLQRDYPIMFGTLFTFSLIGLVIGIITDLTYVLIDPRIDFERR